jgi:hypothetical protein
MSHLGRFLLKWRKRLFYLNFKVSTLLKIVSTDGCSNERSLTRARTRSCRLTAFRRSQCRCTEKSWTTFQWNWSNRNLQVEYDNSAVKSVNTNYRKSVYLVSFSQITKKIVHILTGKKNWDTNSKRKYSLWY